MKNLILYFLLSGAVALVVSAAAPSGRAKRQSDPEDNTYDGEDYSDEDYDYGGMKRQGGEGEDSEGLPEEKEIMKAILENMLQDIQENGDN